MLDKEVYKRPRIHPPTHTRTDILRARIYTHARAYTQKYIMLIAFPLQQWFRERALVLGYTYIACLV
jgi:hypothetical protein